VARVRRLAGTRRVGHAGTLDPMATGVLLLGIGRATRLLGRLALADKAYDATIRLGVSTVTDDAEGDVTASVDAGEVTDGEITAAVAALTGDLEQRPSAVSAIKINGQRAYKRVRAGEDVDLPPRRVTVSRFDLIGVRRPRGLVDLDVEVECSTGTYVRALARDLGAALGVGGHLTRLRRTRVGQYGIARAQTLEAVERGPVAVVPLAEAAADTFPAYRADGDEEKAVRHGGPLRADLGAAGQVAVFSASGEFLALYEQHGPQALAVAVFASSE
jgi:tRNA pseudouridine55 synthase